MTDETRRGVSRRSLLSLGGGAVALPLAGGLAGAARPEPAKAAEPTGAVKHVTVGEGTNIAPMVSPDGKLIAFDLYGVLWVVGVGGGVAKRLTDDYGDIAM